jgi:hypothetical protein
MVARRPLLLLVASLAFAGRTARAQQRPLLTEDAEVIGSGRVVIEAGIDGARDAHFPLSGLEGTEWHVPSVGVSIGLSSIAEFQVDGGATRLLITRRLPAPLSSLVTVTGDSTHDVIDTVVATKIRLVSEAARRPSIGVRFATRLPNARNESGLGLDTFDAFATLLSAKTVRSLRFVANGGVGLLGDPLAGSNSVTVVAYGFSLARAFTPRAELVFDLNGRLSTEDPSPPGTGSRGRVLAGGRFLQGPLRIDAGVTIGVTSADPALGFTAGVTYAFQAFTVN